MAGFWVLHLTIYIFMFSNQLSSLQMLNKMFFPGSIFIKQIFLMGLSLASSSSRHVYLGTGTRLSALPICSASVARRQYELQFNRWGVWAPSRLIPVKVIILLVTASFCLHTGWPLRPNTPQWQMRKISCRHWTHNFAGVTLAWAYLESEHESKNAIRLNNAFKNTQTC